MVTGEKIYKRQNMAYVNAVSDKLFLFCFPRRHSICISSKDAKIKWYESLTDDEDLKSMGLHDAIFAQRFVVHCNVPFVLCPFGLSKEEAAIHYELSYPPSPSLETSPLDEQIQVVYKPNRVPELMHPLLINPITQTDFQLSHNFKQGLSRTNSIYFSVLENQLLLRVYTASRLLLANRYEAQNDDEVFYYIMYTVEQLKLDTSGIHFEFIGPGKNAEVYRELFRNYLPVMHHIPGNLINTEGISPEQKEAFDADWIASVSIQCA